MIVDPALALVLIQYHPRAFLRHYTYFGPPAVCPYTGTQSTDLDNRLGFLQPYSMSEPKAVEPQSQCAANALPGSAPIADKERLLALRELYNWDGPGKWAYTMREECVVVRLDVETPAVDGGVSEISNIEGRREGGARRKQRREYVATFALDLKACA